MLLLGFCSPECLRSGGPEEPVPGDEARLKEPPPSEWLLELLLDRLTRLVAPGGGSGFEELGGGGGAGVAATFDVGFGSLVFDELFRSCLNGSHVREYAFKSVPNQMRATQWRGSKRE